MGYSPWGCKELDTSEQPTLPIIKLGRSTDIRIIFTYIYIYMYKTCFTVSQIRILGEGNGTPLQYSCLENPMDGGAW